MLWVVITIYWLGCFRLAYAFGNSPRVYITWGIVFAFMPIIGALNVAYYGPQWLYGQITRRNRITPEQQWLGMGEIYVE